MRWCWSILVLGVLVFFDGVDLNCCVVLMEGVGGVDVVESVGDFGLLKCVGVEGILFVGSG